MLESHTRQIDASAKKRAKNKYKKEQPRQGKTEVLPLNGQQYNYCGGGGEGGEASTSLLSANRCP